MTGENWISFLEGSAIMLLGILLALIIEALLTIYRVKQKYRLEKMTLIRKELQELFHKLMDSYKEVNWWYVTPTAKNLSEDLQRYYENYKLIKTYYIEYQIYLSEDDHHRDELTKFHTNYMVSTEDQDENAKELETRVEFHKKYIKVQVEHLSQGCLILIEKIKDELNSLSK